MKRNSFLLVQGTPPNVQVKRYEYTSCWHTANKLPAKTVLVNSVFSGEAIFRLSGDVNEQSAMTAGMKTATEHNPARHR
jgi:hypothetical protein